ncbi:LuxR family transcriptional regulator [Mesorhizobium sp. M0761]|uniref:LuxR family transcriptional regulator n=1 Tax=Mesorhizobium sp. M0761 TaxID=2956994 RepID=UPI0033397678
MERAPMTAVSQLRRPATRASDQFSLVPSRHLPSVAGGSFAVEFGRFLDQTDDIAQSKQLFDLLSAFALNFDCLWIAYNSLTSFPKSLNPLRSDPAIMLNYPDKWQQRYLEMGYHSIDPIIKSGRKRAGAFRWSEVYNDASTTKDERRVLDEAATFGLRSGISVPLHGPQGSVAIMSFAQPWNREFQNSTLTYLQLAALHFHLRVAKSESSSGPGEVPKLSIRERECIFWVAKGKSSWEIGKILGISANTVDYHVKNVKQKLNVGSRTVAAIIAADFGVIDL